MSKRDDHEPDPLWKLTEHLRGAIEDGPVPTIAELLARRKARQGGSRPKRPRLFGRWTTATILIAAAVTVVIVRTARTRSPDDPGPLAQAAFATGPTERVTITLGDGTVVRLAPESRLRVVPRPKERALWLEGRAYFAVAKHSYPFVVRTDAGHALAKGTRFDLRAQGDELELVVVEGRVDLAGGSKRVEVAAGEFGKIKGQDTLLVSQLGDVASRLDWMGQFLAFQNTPLSEAAVEISRQYDRTVRVSDSALAIETVSGSFTNESFEDVVKVICRAVEANCVIDPAGVTIEP